MALKTTKQYIEVAKQCRTILNIEKEEWSESLFEIGCEFAEKWYEENYITILSKSNFWDLWTIEFIKDDELLIRKFLEVLEDTATGTRKQKYFRYKAAMVHDRALLRTIDDFINYNNEQKTQQSVA